MDTEPTPGCCSVDLPTGEDGGGSNCPACGHRGKPVRPVTIESLVVAQARERLGALTGLRFCSQVGCELAYFRPETGERVLVSEVRIEIGQKSTDPGRTVCYCFEHTAAELEAEVAATGTSTIPDAIGAKCKQGLDRCEETNPQGSCCLGNVRQTLKAALERHEDPKSAPLLSDGGGGKAASAPKSSRKSGRLGLWASGGALLSAVLSSACCWLPLLLIAFGASAAGVAGFFEEYRPVLLGVTTVLLASGFYLVYFRKERCEPGQACALPNPKLRRFNQITLLVATGFVAAFAFFPNYVGVFLGSPGSPDAAVVAGAQARVFHIEGMTCEACAIVLHEDLSKLPGVAAVEVSFEARTAEVFFDPEGMRPTDEAIEDVIEADGYRGVPATP